MGQLLLYTAGNFRGQADLHEICPHVNGLPERKQWSQTKCLLTKITVFELNEPTKITRYTVLNGGSYSYISPPTPHTLHTHSPSISSSSPLPAAICLRCCLLGVRRFLSGGGFLKCLSSGGILLTSGLRVLLLSVVGSSTPSSVGFAKLTALPLCVVGHTTHSTKV